MANGSVHVIEFQTKRHRLSLLKELDYATLVARAVSRSCEEYVPVFFSTVFCGGNKPRPKESYPHKRFKKKGSLLFRPRQIYLEDLIDIAKEVRENRDVFESLKHGAGGSPLTGIQRIRWFLAPLGRIPADPLSTTKEYLDLSRDWAEKTGNPDILEKAITAVCARGNIAKEISIHEYREVLAKMGIDYVQFMNNVSSGEYSKLRKELKTTYKELETKDKVIKTKDKVIETKDKELETTHKELETKDKVIADTLSRAVRALHNAQKTKKQISEELDLTLPEVAKILRRIAKGG
jgi:hypothetical protein